MVNVTPKQCGKNVRMNFGKINEVLEMPNLIEVQKNSYRWFREEGLKEVFRDVSSITDYNGNLVLNFIDYRIDEKPKYTIAECKEQDATYAAALRVTATLWNKETGEVKESEIYMGDFPLMTESGTFVINGAERVIVSQLVRSPGVYYASEKDRTGKDLFKTTVIPNRGAWLEYEMDSNDVIYVRIDKNRKIALTTFIRAIGIGTDEEIYEMFGDDERLRQTILQKDSTKNTEDALLDVYKKLRPGEPPTVESSLTHLNNLLHGADHGRIKLLLCQGLAPTAYLVYYCVKDMSRIFFKSLTQAAGRRSPRHHRCRCRGRPKGGPLWESREMLCSEIAVHRSRIIACGDIFVVHRSSFIHMLALYVKKKSFISKILPSINNIEKNTIKSSFYNLI